MADDFNNLRDLKKLLCKSTGDCVDLKQAISSRLTKRVCFIITKKKNSSWVDDLDAREKLNRINRVYH